MADIIDEIRRKEFDNLKEDLCSTYEGAVFMETYLRGRNTISELEDKVISAIRDSNFSTTQAIGFMQYMKYAIKNRSSVPQSKEHK